MGRERTSWWLGKKERKDVQWILPYEPNPENHEAGYVGVVRDVRVLHRWSLVMTGNGGRH